MKSNVQILNGPSLYDSSRQLSEGAQQRDRDYLKECYNYYLRNKLILNPESFNNPYDIILFENNITPEGRALFWGAHMKFLAAVQRGTEYSKIKVLDRELKKIRDVGPKEYLKNTRFYLYNDDFEP